MNVNGLANAASSVADAGLKQEASFAVLKKAMNIESESAAQLIEAARPAPNLPPNLGRNINTTA